MRKIVLLTLMIILGGCASTHSKPTVAFAAEKNECRISFSLSGEKNELTVSFSKNDQQIETFSSATSYISVVDFNKMGVMLNFTPAIQNKDYRAKTYLVSYEQLGFMAVWFNILHGVVKIDPEQLPDQPIEPPQPMGKIARQY